MAEGDVLFPNRIKMDIWKKLVDIENDDFYMMLLVGLTLDIDTHALKADIVANEASGPGYTAGGTLMTGLAITQDNALNRAKIVWDPVVFSALDVGTPSHTAVVDMTVAGNPVVLYVVLGSPSNGEDYTIGPDASGAILTRQGT